MYLNVNEDVYAGKISGHVEVLIFIIIMRMCSLVLQKVNRAHVFFKKTCLVENCIYKCQKNKIA